MRGCWGPGENCKSFTFITLWTYAETLPVRHPFFFFFSSKDYPPLNQPGPRTVSVVRNLRVWPFGIFSLALKRAIIWHSVGLVPKTMQEDTGSVPLCASAVWEDRHNKHEMIMWFIWIQSFPSCKKIHTRHLFHKSFFKMHSHIIAQLFVNYTEPRFKTFQYYAKCGEWGPLYSFYCEIPASFYL